MGITLRTYQEELINGLRGSINAGHKRLIGVLPTGGGKTVTFSYIVKNAWERGAKVLILTDRIELLTQAGGSLKNIGLDPIKIEAGKKVSLKGSLYVGMIETVARRMDKDEYMEWAKGLNLVIIDECHKRSFKKFVDKLSDNTVVIGFTATPVRQGKNDQLAETYTDIVQGVDIDYLVENKYLAFPNYYGVKADLSGVKMKAGDYNQDQVAEKFSKAKLYRGVVENWKDKTPNTKTLIFSSNIESSLEVVDEFKRTGKPVRHLDSTMSKKERDSILRWFNQTDDGILSNVGILTTGFDEPTIETVILYRATKSLSLYLQMVGRGSRTAPGKDQFNILDFGNNILTHGFWHEPRTWKLEIEPKKSRKKGEAVLKNCPQCEAFIAASAIKCPECGFVDQKEKKEQEFAKLELLNPWELNRIARKESFEKQIELAKRKLVKPAYLLHRMTDINEVVKFIDALGYNRYWLENNHHRFKWGEQYLKLKTQLL